MSPWGATHFMSAESRLRVSEVQVARDQGLSLDGDGSLVAQSGADSEDACKNSEGVREGNVSTPHSPSRQLQQEGEGTCCWRRYLRRPQCRAVSRRFRIQLLTLCRVGD